MNNLFDFLNTSSERITMFSLEHLAWLSLYLIVLIFLIVKCRNISDFKLRVIIFILGTIFFILELLKNYTRYADDSGHWDMKIEHFQFQFCSMPVYLTAIIALLPKKKLFNIGLTFLATYCMIAGLFSVILCDTISSTIAFIQWHSFFLHGAMFVLGVYLLIAKRIDFKLSSFIGAASIFLILAGCASILNVLTYHYSPDEATDFFYISPFVMKTPDIIDPLREAVPYPIYLLGYLFGFTGLAFGCFKLGSIKFNKKRLSTDTIR